MLLTKEKAADKIRRSKSKEMLGFAQRYFALCGERPKALPLETANL